MFNKKNAYKRRIKLSESAKEDFERFYKYLEESDYKEGESEYENVIDIIKWIHPEVISITPGGAATYNKSLIDKIRESPGDIEWNDIKKGLLSSRQLKREFYDYSELDCSDKGKELLNDYFNSGFGVFGKSTLGTYKLVGDSISLDNIYLYNNISISKLRICRESGRDTTSTVQIYPFVVINKKVTEDFTFQSEFDKDGKLADVYKKYKITFEASGNHDKVYLRFFIENFCSSDGLSLELLSSKKKIYNYYLAINIILMICNEILEMKL